MLRSLTRAPKAYRRLIRPQASYKQVRCLDVHEYQSQELMRSMGLPLPMGIAASTVDEARAAAEKLGPETVVKAQVLAGGRGLGHFKGGLKGGVHLTSTPDEAAEKASQMLGDILVTKQTGEAGKPVNQVLIAQKETVAKEAYLSILMDRASGGPVIIGSSAGGVNIEDTAENEPEKIMKIEVDITKGLNRADAEKMAQFIGFGNQTSDTADVIEGLYEFFLKNDATMVEVNPLAQNSDERVMIFDAKVNFDDNAEFRQRDIFALKDVSQIDPREAAAAKWDLNYVGLDGNIGCLVNGAGLAMATMDIIQLHGGMPANFLDVGGGATEDQVYHALELITSDNRVEAILVNIFGGIMRCDIIAAGLIKASQQLGLEVPIVVRLEGTNQEEGRRMIRESNMKILNAEDLDEAAKKAVQAAAEHRS